MVNARKEVDIKNLGRVLLCEAPFGEALVAVKKKGGEIISAEKLAYARIQKTPEHSLSQNGSYVKEGSLFVPNAEHKRILLRESLVLKNPSAAVEAHRKNQEYSLGQDFSVEAYLESLPEGSYLIIDDLSRLPTNRFGEDERAIWLFGKHAGDYGLFLKEAGVESTGFYLYTDNDSYVDVQENPFANQLWLDRVGNDSDINGYVRSLNYYDRVRGVAQKNFPQETKVRGKQALGKANIPRQTGYSPNQIRAALSRLQLEGLEKLLLRELKK